MKNFSLPQEQEISLLENFKVAQNRIDISYIDYPNKISYLIHTTKCNLSCSYCHNKKHLLDIKGLMITDYLQELLDYKSKTKDNIDSIIISGGEPLCEYDKLITFLCFLKDYRFNIKLDTNGTYPYELKQSVKYLDYVAMDLKWNIFDKGSCNMIYKLIATSTNSIEVFNSKIKESLDLLVYNKTINAIDFELRTTLCFPYFNSITSFFEFVRLIDEYISSTYKLHKKINWYIQTPILDENVIYNHLISHKLLKVGEIPEFTNIELKER